MATPPSIPFIDPNVDHVGVSRLRQLNASSLRANDRTLVIQEKDAPLAVLLRYEQYLAIQEELQRLIATVETLSDEADLEGLTAGLDDLNAGRTRSLSAIEDSLEKIAEDR